MLLGQDFGGRHKGDLQAVLHRNKGGQQRDDRLAGTDVTLQQPVHRRGTLHVFDDLFQRAPLSFGQPEWQECRAPNSRMRSSI